MTTFSDQFNLDHNQSQHIQDFVNSCTHILWRTHHGEKQQEATHIGHNEKYLRVNLISIWNCIIYINETAHVQ
jgi:hypothetical protein